MAKDARVGKPTRASYFGGVATKAHSYRLRSCPVTPIFGVAEPAARPHNVGPVSLGFRVLLDCQAGLCHNPWYSCASTNGLPRLLFFSMLTSAPTAASAQTLREEVVAQLWQACPWGAKLLPTTAGEQIQVVYPGRRNLGPGPDFLDAIMALDGRRLRHGHVEVHTNASAWRAHGHASDPAYHNVMLHVVWEDDGLIGGGPLRTLALSPYFPDGMPEQYAAQRLPSFQPCSDLHTKSDAMTVGMLFATLGERRMRKKAAQMLAAIENLGPEQALYAALLDALGYSQNREPFRQLSGALPWSVVEPILGGKADAALRGEALFLGAAGLLPSQRGTSPRTGTACRAPTAADHAYMQELESLWRNYQLEPALPATAWVRAGVRPTNAPARRVAAAGHLCARLAETGPLQACLNLRDGPPWPQLLHRITNAFALPASSSRYWATHCDFGVPLRGAGPEPHRHGARPRSAHERLAAVHARTWRAYRRLQRIRLGRRLFASRAGGRLEPPHPKHARRRLRLAAKIRAHDCRAPAGAAPRLPYLVPREALRHLCRGADAGETVTAITALSIAPAVKSSLLGIAVLAHWAEQVSTLHEDGFRLAPE